MSSETITFTETGTFKALDAARDWLRQRGYSDGCLQQGAPIAIKKGNHIIGKWRNLDASDRAVMDGTMEGDFRNGPVTIKLKDGHDH